MKFVKQEINIEDDMLVVDKPEDWTSHDVVAKIRGGLSKLHDRKVKVGHGGTLDPFATGVLLILVGKATKRFDEIKGWDKEYVMEIKLGEATDTGDRTGKVTKKEKLSKIEKRAAEGALSGFVGEYEQSVPAYSAVKVKGRKLYQLARKGVKIKLPKKKVKIKELELLNLQGSVLKVRVVCGSGTYMRQLAVDIGEKLGLPAMAKELRRTRVGEFTLLTV